ARHGRRARPTGGARGLRTAVPGPAVLGTAGLFPTVLGTAGLIPAVLGTPGLRTAGRRAARARSRAAHVAATEQPG
ncbi:hypothetical protein ACSNOB_25415, partial [Micromonospora sp. URMC 106]|uniref:hypothetical protein n=1 Tax=Micromonospora sp. URMC 106 TaxID=3423408 RepID=UPI003F1AAA22